MIGVQAAEPSYVAGGRRGQELLDRGKTTEAIEVFERVLNDLGARPSYGRAVVLERVARAYLVAGAADRALERLREALDVAGRLAPSYEVQRLRRAVRSSQGDGFRAAGRPAEARRAYLAAAELGRELGDAAGESIDQARLASLARAEGDVAEAVAHYRAAVESSRRSGASLRLAGLLTALAELLRERPDGQDGARRAAAEALTVAQSVDATAAEAWAAYGVLGALPPERPELRELGLRAPAIVAVGRRLAPGPSLARAVILGRIGRCFGVGERPDLAGAWLRRAVEVAEQLPVDRDTAELLDMLRSDLSTLSGGQPGPLVDAGPEYEGAILVVEQVATDYAFDPNLLLDGPRARRIVRAEPASVPETARPLLVPTTRTWLGADTRIHIAPPADEPDVRVDGACTVLRRTSREISIGGSTDLAWRLLAAMDGHTTWREILTAVAEGQRVEAEHIVAALAGAGALDLSGRPVGRFLHWATRKGVLPAGGLDDDNVLRHASVAPEGAAGERRLGVGATVPERLRAFHALTRARRSTRAYAGGELSREELDAVLHTACGVTGAFRWAAGEVKLRAYPSSGALYAVGIYPLAVRVEGLAPSVLRFDPEAAELAVLGPLEPTALVAAALPMEREMVAGIAAMVCLTGRFPRHERKYGEGGYRMLVAEAGHISQNLVLAATALGLAARPFGGVFDRQMDGVLGLEPSSEQFLLAVVIGR